MKRSLLEILVCPECASNLELESYLEENFKAREVMEGLLLCKACARRTPVIHGIPRFVPNALSPHAEFFKKYPQALQGLKEEEFEKVHGATQERFGFEWMNYPGSLEEDREIFLEETQVPVEIWAGKRILDAGCGMGRYPRVAHGLGAEVVAFDLSEALVRLWDVAKGSEKMHLVQGNLLSLPFKKESFDIVYSLGVIHHTPSAKKCFDALSGLVKKKGILSLWVYGTYGSYRNFKTNPLKENRRGLKKFIFFVWLVVFIRELISSTLRFFSVHVPHRVLYLFCYPLAWIGKIPLVKYLTFSVHPLWRVRLQENFDWLTPPYQSHHTKEELIQWFKRGGFQVLKVLSHGFVPKPGICGQKK